MNYYAVFLILLIGSTNLTETAENYVTAKWRTKYGEAVMRDFGAVNELDLMTNSQSFTSSMIILIQQFSQGKNELALAGMETLVVHPFFKATITEPGFETLAQLGSNPSNFLQKFGSTFTANLLKKFHVHSSHAIGYACLTYSAYHLLKGGHNLWKIYKLYLKVGDIHEKYVELKGKIEKFIKDGEIYVAKVAEFEEKFININKPVDFSSSPSINDEQNVGRKILSENGEELRKRYGTLEKEIGDLTKDINIAKRDNKDNRVTGVDTAMTIGSFAAIGVVGKALSVAWVATPIGQAALGVMGAAKLVHYFWSSSASLETEDFLDGMLLDLDKLKQEMDLAIRLVREANAKIDLGYAYDYMRGNDVKMD